jgi:ferredoxin
MAYKISEKCTACGTCFDTCPSEAIVKGDKFKIDADKCIDCAACESACPESAISAGN